MSRERDLFIMNMLDRAYNAITSLYAKALKETVEIDGQTLVVDREPHFEKPAFKQNPLGTPLDMKIDLDKVNVDKEMAMLAEYERKKTEAAIATMVNLEMIKEMYNGGL